MPIITQLLTDSEYARLKHLLGEDSFFDRGDPNAIALLRRDMNIATRIREISPHFTRNGTNGTGRSSDQWAQTTHAPEALAFYL